MEQSLFENENGNFAKPVLGVVASTTLDTKNKTFFVLNF
jgi:hypothetical protein